MRAGVAAAVDAFGRLDIVVADAAAVTPTATVDALAEKDWREALDVNLTGAFLLCKHALPYLRAQQSGSVILIASQLGSVAWSGQSAYCATKGALIQLAKAMAPRSRARKGFAGKHAVPRPARRRSESGSALARRNGRKPLWGPMHPVGTARSSGGDRSRCGLSGERRVVVHDRRGPAD